MLFYYDIMVQDKIFVKKEDGIKKKGRDGEEGEER